MFQWQITTGIVRHYCASALAVAIAVPLSGCGSNHEQLAELKEIRSEIAALRKDLKDALVKSGDQSAQKSGGESAPARIELGDSPILGQRTARLAIVEFSDYQCPFCAKFHSGAFETIKKKYIDTGKVLLVFRDFPLTSHPEAKPAAIAARCAGAQGGYWAMQRELFSQSRALGSDLYTQLGKKLQLKLPAYSKCMRDTEVAARVDRDFAYGSSIGVRGTPTFYIGRHKDGYVTEITRLGGAQPAEAFSVVIDKLL